MFQYLVNKKMKEKKLASGGLWITSQGKLHCAPPSTLQGQIGSALLSKRLERRLDEVIHGIDICLAVWTRKTFFLSSAWFMRRRERKPFSRLCPSDWSPQISEIELKLCGHLIARQWASTRVIESHHDSHLPHDANSSRFLKTTKKRSALLASSSPPKLGDQ
jgi:hypothetical protein